jgi:hypothetical protein
MGCKDGDAGDTLTGIVSCLYIHIKRQADDADWATLLCLAIWLYEQTESYQQQGNPDTRMANPKQPTVYSKVAIVRLSGSGLSPAIPAPDNGRS